MQSARIFNLQFRMMTSLRSRSGRRISDDKGDGGRWISDDEGDGG